MKADRVLMVFLVLSAIVLRTAAPALAQDKKPNILVIMGDDIGWFNLGSYNQGIMLQATPNLDKLASEGMRFTDYYAEASCTAGRANFITGELPIRTRRWAKLDLHSACPRKRRPLRRRSRPWDM
jgi:arylsulfatase A-like enzyme